MSETLKVNSKTSTLEFKRKHKLVDACGEEFGNIEQSLTEVTDQVEKQGLIFDEVEVEIDPEDAHTFSLSFAKGFYPTIFMLHVDYGEDDEDDILVEISYSPNGYYGIIPTALISSDEGRGDNMDLIMFDADQENNTVIQFTLSSETFSLVQVTGVIGFVGNMYCYWEL